MVVVGIVGNRNRGGGVTMKDFAEFKETLTRDVLDGLAKTALETTNKLLDTKYGEGELEKHFAFFDVFYTETYGILLLERYHLWING